MLKRNRSVWAMVVMVIFALSFTGFAEGVTNATKTVITSDSLMFDYGRSTCIFDGNVVVDDPRIKMECNKLYVFFDATNNVDSIVATESVKIWQEDRRGVCDKAVYTAKTGTIVMTGNPKLQSGNNMVRGDEIKIFVDSEKVFVDSNKVKNTSRVKLVVFPGDVEKQRKKSGR